MLGCVSRYPLKGFQLVKDVNHRGFYAKSGVEGSNQAVVIVNSSSTGALRLPVLNDRSIRGTTSFSLQRNVQRIMLVAMSSILQCVKVRVLRKYRACSIRRPTCIVFHVERVYGNRVCTFVH